MKIGFVQSGGVMGLVKGCELDTQSLPTEVGEELQRLVRESELLHSEQLLSTDGRDLQEYEITIEDGSHKVAVTFDDATVKQRAKPMLGFLKKHAQPMGLT